MACFHFSKKANVKITIQTKTITTDNMGGQVTTWVDDSNPWAYMTSKNTMSREKFSQDQLQSITVHEFLIRYNSNYKSTKDFGSYRISFDDRIFNVQNIINLDENAKNDAGTVYQKITAIENMAEVQ